LGLILLCASATTTATENDDHNLVGLLLHLPKRDDWKWSTEKGALF
jgi:hypothetical protein